MFDLFAKLRDSAFWLSGRGRILSMTIEVGGGSTGKLSAQRKESGMGSVTVLKRKAA
jgi:hypothetical protein